MHEIYELKEMLCRELEEYGRKGEMTAGTLDIVDKLAHAVKNLGKIVEMAEEDGYSEAGGGSYRQGQGGGGGNRYSRDGGGNRRYNREGYGGGSYARGRSRNTNRDGRGRYSGGVYDYSMAEDGMEDIVTELREMAQELPEEKKREVMKFVQKMEQM